MTGRILLALIGAVLLSYASVVIWERLRENEREQIARITESESYASRSRLVRNFESLLGALRDVHVYWSTFGHLPLEEWADGSAVDLSHFSGIELILWSGPDRTLRYLRNAQHPVLGYRPDDEEWSAYEAFLSKAEGLEADRLFGPYETSDGQILMELYLVPKSGQVNGTLIALLDTREVLEGLLQQDSPGFSIIVKSAGSVIYQRGQRGLGFPEAWSRGGFIEMPFGTVWEVIHTPTAVLANSLRTPAVNAVLYSGIAIAVLMGLLFIENGRAGNRARAAQSAQMKLAELNLELENQVEERTEALEERSRDLMTITDSVGHDLRNPLNSISANVQLMEQQFAPQLGEDGLKILGKLSSGVQRISEILDRLLSLSTVSNVEFERERLDMKEMAEEIFDELSASEPGPPVDFHAEEVPDAMGQPVLVQTLLMNLFSNALKYSRTKSDRKIIFACKEVEGVPAYYVQDNGIGFDSDMSEKMFSAFKRLASGSVADGLGLGLDIASRVVRRHNGRIWAEGKPGAGATFYFTLGGDGVVET